MLSSSGARLVAVSFLLVVAAHQAAAAEDSILVRPAGQSLQAFAAAIIPPDMRLAHQVVSGDIGPFRQSLVVLFHSDEYRGFIGWVLTPENGGYRKHVLPDVQLPVSTEVKAVFFADTNGAQERELLILAEHISGVGSYPGNVKPFCSTYAYAWNGTAFTFLEDVSARLDRCTVAGVRQQLTRPPTVRRKAKARRRTPGEGPR